MTATEKLKVRWIDGQREPQCPPDPRYPKGIDIDMSKGIAKTCSADLPYPAKRCGVYVVTCQTCGLHTVVSTAGRCDDPRSIRVACRLS
jgi:hypothetical protein